MKSTLISFTSVAHRLIFSLTLSVPYPLARPFPKTCISFQILETTYPKLSYSRPMCLLLCYLLVGSRLGYLQTQWRAICGCASLRNSLSTSAISVSSGLHSSSNCEQCNMLAQSPTCNMLGLKRISWFNSTKDDVKELVKYSESPLNCISQ